MVAHYPILFAEQLRQHLRALRKTRSLTQAQLGQLIGVSQARIAEIEANPGLVSFEQLLKILSALDVTLALHEKGPSPDKAAPGHGVRAPSDDSADHANTIPRDKRGVW